MDYRRGTREKPEVLKRQTGTGELLSLCSNFKNKKKRERERVDGSGAYNLG